MTNVSEVLVEAVIVVRVREGGFRFATDSAFGELPSVKRFDRCALSTYPLVHSSRRLNLIGSGLGKESAWIVPRPPGFCFEFVSGKNDQGSPGGREEPSFPLPGVGHGLGLSDPVHCRFDSMDGALVPYDTALAGVMRTPFVLLATGISAVNVAISSAGSKLYATSLLGIATFSAV